MVLLVKAPFLILSFLVRHTVLLILVIVVVVALFASHTIGKNNEQNNLKVNFPAYQTIAPSRQMAPIAIQSPTRVYYVSSLSENGDIVNLLVWYDYNEETWQRHDTLLPLNRSEVKIYNRGG